MKRRESQQLGELQQTAKDFVGAMKRALADEDQVLSLCLWRQGRPAAHRGHAPQGGQQGYEGDGRDAAAR